MLEQLCAARSPSRRLRRAAASSPPVWCALSFPRAPGPRFSRPGASRPTRARSCARSPRATETQRPALLANGRPRRRAQRVGHRRNGLLAVNLHELTALLVELNQRRGLREKDLDAVGLHLGGVVRPLVKFGPV